MFAASASNKAINARLSVGNCWRQSARNHCPSTERLRLNKRFSALLSNTGKASAAPSNKAVIRTKPLARLSPQINADAAINAATVATQPWRRSHRAWA
ncbi:hypothetical protein D3C76_1136780 [compost metagenome]